MSKRPNRNLSPSEQAFDSERRKWYTDLATVESQRNEIIPEEFPDGSYGSIFAAEKTLQPKEWREDQRSLSGFTYEYRSFHEGLDRGGYPGQHDTHDSLEDYDEEYPGE